MKKWSLTINIGNNSLHLTINNKIKNVEFS